MNKLVQLISLLTVMALLYAPVGFSQDNEPAETAPTGTETDAATPEDSDVPAGQEVEINEDNYRQFMELRDPLEQRSGIPEDAFKPGTGLQKLDKLPEESQKHLRNQLREVIVQSDQWKPGY
jgi:hypothetical protein